MRSGAPPPAEPGGGDGLRESQLATPAETRDRRGGLRVEPHAIVVAVILTVIWGWWAWKQGAYFGTILLPGTILLCGTIILLALTAPMSMRFGLNPPARLALGAIIALACWTLVSALWSPAPDVAVTYAQRVMTYALAFGIGLWLCCLAGRRTELALVPLAVAGGGVAIATTLTILVGTDVHRYLEVDGTLQFPLGYRNANAAFFFIATWPALGLAATPRLDWRARGLALGAATLCLELGLLCQSRGSAIAAPIAVFVYLLAAPRRTVALGWLALAALPALLVVGHLSPLYHAALGHRPILDDLRSAATVAAIGAGIAVLAGAAVARLGRRLPAPPSLVARSDRVVLLGVILMPLAAVAVYVIAIGNPVGWINQRVNQFNRGENTAIERQATRFGFNAGTSRGDFWRIALLAARDDPVVGTGAGGYRYFYLRHRHSPTTTIRDAHSVELETLSELGVVGLALLLTAIGGAVLGILRSRRVDPPAAGLGAVALAAGAYWLAHTSIDWFWPYPAVTAPVICLAGAACAPALRARLGNGGRTVRRVVIAGAAVLALSVVPPFVSERYVDAAFASWRDDLPAAYSDLSAAKRWNPLSEEPYLATGAIARAAGDRGRAIAAFSAAAEKRPEDWAPRYYLATLYARSAPRRALAAVEAGLRLDPREPALHGLRRRLDGSG